jgi:hypothetical protein
MTKYFPKLMFTSEGDSAMADLSALRFAAAMPGRLSQNPSSSVG